MSLLRRTTSRRARARRAVATKSRSVRRAARRRGIRNTARTVVPTRVAVAAGGAVAAVAGALALKKRSGSAEPPAYVPPAPPAPPTPQPPAS